MLVLNIKVLLHSELNISATQVISRCPEYDCVVCLQLEDVWLQTALSIVRSGLPK